MFDSLALPSDLGTSPTLGSIGGLVAGGGLGLLSGSAIRGHTGALALGALGAATWAGGYFLGGALLKKKVDAGSNITLADWMLATSPAAFGAMWIAVAIYSALAPPR